MPVIDSVLHVTPAIFGARGVFGGAERYVHAVAKALQTQGIDSQKIVGFTNGAVTTWRDDSVEVQLLSTDNHSPNQMDWYGRSLWEVMSRFEVVHVHQPFTKCGQVALTAASELGKVIVATDLGGAMPPSNLSDHPISLCHGMVAISEFSASLLNNTIGVPISVISGPVDPEFLTPLGGVQKRDALFVGRILPHKGVDRLIEAAPRNLKVTIAGTSPDAEYLRFLKVLSKGKDVRFVGAVTNDRLPALYESAAIHVAPSVTTDYRGGFHPNSELMGLTTIESLCRGTPVAVANTCSLPSLINDSVGVIYDTVEELRDVLMQVSAGQWAPMYSAASVRSFAVDRYSPDVVGRKMLQAYLNAKAALA